jgi:hypothetical protein
MFDSIMLQALELSFRLEGSLKLMNQRSEIQASLSLAASFSWLKLLLLLALALFNT